MDPKVVSLINIVVKAIWADYALSIEGTTVQHRVARYEVWVEYAAHYYCIALVLRSFQNFVEG